jgi:spore coat polysaccharide biosynthesis predicted glycosyltransferase SpsG
MKKTIDQYEIHLSKLSKLNQLINAEDQHKNFSEKDRLELMQSKCISYDNFKYASHFLNGKIFQEVYSVLNKGYQKADQLLNIDHNQCKSYGNIIRKVHTVWVTDPKNPKESFPDQALETKILLNKHILQSCGYEWEFIIWTNDKSLLPNTMNFVNKNGIKLKNVYDLDPYSKTTFDYLINAASKSQYFKKGFLSMTSDLLRYHVLKQFGGLYLDIDYKLLKNPEYIFHHVDILVGMLRDVHPLLISSSFVYAKKEHPIAIKALQNVNEAVNAMKRNDWIEKVITNFYTKKHGHNVINFYDINDLRHGEDFLYTCDLSLTIDMGTGPGVISKAFYEKVDIVNRMDLNLLPGVLHQRPSSFNEFADRFSDVNAMYTNFHVQDLNRLHFSLGMIGQDIELTGWYDDFLESQRINLNQQYFSKKNVLTLPYPIYSHTNVFAPFIKALSQSAKQTIFTTDSIKNLLFSDIDANIQTLLPGTDEAISTMEAQQSCFIRHLDKPISEQQSICDDIIQVKNLDMQNILEVVTYVNDNKLKFDAIMYDTGMPEYIPFFLAEVFQIPHVIRYFPNFLSYNNDMVQNDLNDEEKENAKQICDDLTPVINFVQDHVPEVLSKFIKTKICVENKVNHIKVRNTPQDYLENDVDFDENWIFMGNRFGLTKKYVDSVSQNLKEKTFPSEPNLLITLGSFVNFASLLDKILESMIMQNPTTYNITVSKSNQNYDELEQKYKSDKVHFVDFVDQIDFLRNHCNVFISACGGSGYESVYYSVPLVCIPLGPDQFYHSNRLVRFGVAKIVNFKDNEMFGGDVVYAVSEIEKNWEAYMHNLDETKNLIFSSLTPLEAVDYLSVLLEQ